MTSGETMARRTWSQARLAWWAGIAALCAAAVYAGTWRMWALTVLVWSLYELCFCPTSCGVATRDGGPCRNGARGRLFACTDVTGHQQLKTDALWRPAGVARLRLTDVPAAHRKAPLHSAGSASVEPAQRLIAYAAVLSLVATIAWTALAL